MTPLNFEDTSSIDTFPLATFHTDSLQPDTTTTPDWQRLNTIINQRSNRARHNQNPAVTEKILRATNYHWVAGQLEHPLTRTNYHWEVPCQTIYVPTPTDIVPLDDISMSSLDTLVSTTMMTDDHSLQDTFSISTISDFSFEEHNNPGFTHTTPPHDNAMGTTDIVTTPIHPEPTNLSLTDEVHRIVTGTSQKFVPHPPFDVVATDAFKGLKRFATTVRLKEDFINQQKQKHEQLNQPTSNSSSFHLSLHYSWSQNNLKPTRCCGQHKAAMTWNCSSKILIEQCSIWFMLPTHYFSDPTTQTSTHATLLKTIQIL
ncbi:expressed unknown protein [Seminavis robusta]|uniref:Uncharacterized protein n=1 Tax=Seminavis robusta TaxID=568900 RepID=A0A9N8ELJ3_9STRA|nr:expressed unknown protein [Seminavis robusta]|eukprot:Sro1200_g251830.1 n/a (315) ;mRNA; r:6581-7525